MICFGLIILASVVNISYFTYNKTENYLDELSSSALEEVLRQANATLDYRIKNYERVINTFYISDEFRKALTGKYDDKYEDLKINEGLRDFVESILNTYEYVPRVKVYNFNDYTYSGLIYKGSEITDEIWKREVIANTAHSVLWTNRFSEYDDNNLQSLVAAKALRFNSYVYGIVSFEIAPFYMFNQLDDIDLFNGGNVYALDRTGTTIYRQDDVLGDKPGDRYRLYEKMTGNDGSFIETIDGAPYFVVYSKVQDVGWTLVGVKPMQGAMSISREVRQYVFLLTVALLVIGFIAIYGLSYFFTRRIGLLTIEMSKVSKGMFDIQVDMSSNDEIGRMNRVFNHMVSKLRKNMDDIREMEAAETELRMKALQMQINPHFLYNTLSMINWMAMNAKAPDISNAVNALAKYYRIGLNNGREIVAIREELDHVGNYIFIQRIRTKDNIVYEIEADEETLEFRMPKMVLQPIVENAIYHGIEKTRKKGIIRITVRREGERISLMVSDDGTGMDGSKIRELADPYASRGYGLVNIESKLKLYFGQSYSLRIESEPGCGTTVIIEIPAVTQLREKERGRC